MKTAYDIFPDSTTHSRTKDTRRFRHILSSLSLKCRGKRTTVDEKWSPNVIKTAQNTFEAILHSWKNKTYDSFSS
jgi:hypothetical protein